MRKRKVNYPVAKTDTKRARPGAGDDPAVRPTLATIDLTARTGGGDFAVGERVRIAGTGLLAGESAVIQSLSGGVIPGATVKTESGRTARVRTIDLRRMSEASDS